MDDFSYRALNVVFHFLYCLVDDEVLGLLLELLAHPIVLSLRNTFNLGRLHLFETLTHIIRLYQVI